MSVKQLTDDIKNGALSRLYYIYGGEEYLKRTYFDQLKAAGAPELPEFNLIELTGKDFDLTDFMNSVNSYPMMSDSKLVAVTDMDNSLLKKEFTSKLTAFLGEIPEFCTVVFYDSELKRDQNNTALLKAMERAGAVIVNVEHPPLKSLTAWCARHFKDGGKQASADVINYLFEYSGTDMLVLKNEIDKLCSGAAGDAVTKSDIDLLATRSIDADKYRMIEAFCKKDYAGLLDIIEGLYLQGVDDIAIANVLYYAFLDLRHARETIDCNRTRQELVNVFGMRPFVADRTLRNARELSSSFIKKALNEALELDVKLKSTSFNKRELITVFVARLAGERDHG